MAVFLAADLAVFLALFISYVYLRSQAPAWPAQFHFASGLMAVSTTLFTLAGSVAMHYAALHQRKESYEVAMRLALATLAVWASVVILLAMEWVRLIAILEISFTTNLFSSTYFLLTGFYLLHVLAGWIYVSVVASRVRQVDCGKAALFVHFVNVVWIFVFIGVYLASADLQGI